MNNYFFPSLPFLSIHLGASHLRREQNWRARELTLFVCLTLTHRTTENWDLLLFYFCPLSLSLPLFIYLLFILELTTYFTFGIKLFFELIFLFRGAIPEQEKNDRNIQKYCHALMTRVFCQQYSCQQQNRKTTS